MRAASSVRARCQRRAILRSLGGHVATSLEAVEGMAHSRPRDGAVGTAGLGGIWGSHAAGTIH